MPIPVFFWSFSSTLFQLKLSFKFGAHKVDDWSPSLSVKCQYIMVQTTISDSKITFSLLIHGGSSYFWAKNTDHIYPILFPLYSHQIDIQPIHPTFVTIAQIKHQIAISNYAHDIPIVDGYIQLKSRSISLQFMEITFWTPANFITMKWQVIDLIKSHESHEKMDLRTFSWLSLGAHNAYNAKFCLCTSGGGARAMTHTMGVYRALHEMGILEEVDGISPLALELTGSGNFGIWKKCWGLLEFWRFQNFNVTGRLLVTFKVSTQFNHHETDVFSEKWISNNSLKSLSDDTQMTLVWMWNGLSKSTEFYVPYLLYVPSETCFTVYHFFLCHFFKSGGWFSH